LKSLLLQITNDLLVEDYWNMMYYQLSYLSKEQILALDNIF